MWHLCTDFIPRDFKIQSWSERRLYGEQNINLSQFSSIVGLPLCTPVYQTAYSDNASQRE